MKRIYQRQEFKTVQADAWRKLGEQLDFLQEDKNNKVLPPASAKT